MYAVRRTCLYIFQAAVHLPRDTGDIDRICIWTLLVIEMHLVGRYAKGIVLIISVIYLANIKESPVFTVFVICGIAVAVGCFSCIPSISNSLSVISRHTKRRVFVAAERHCMPIFCP